jgi:F-type H+-transporting ATPase subunit a
MFDLLLNYVLETANVEIGQHFYWNFGNLEVHGQVLINSWIVFAIIIILAVSTTREMCLIPDGGQNFIESVVEFINDIAKTQIGEKVRNGFLFIFYKKMNFSSF